MKKIKELKINWITTVNYVKSIKKICSIWKKYFSKILPKTMNNNEIIENNDFFNKNIVPKITIYSMDYGLVSNDSEIISNDWILIFDFLYSSINPVYYNIFKKRVLKNIYYYDKIVLCFSQPYNTCYWDFLNLMFPILLNIVQKWIKFDYIYIQWLNFQVEYLKILWIQDKKIIKSQDFPVVYAKKLIIPYIDWWINNYPFEILKKFISMSNSIPHYHSTYSKKIYISRKKAKTRKIMNDEKLLFLLKKYWFNEIVLEEKTIEEQISIFKNADIIIWAHWSWFANVIYCKKWTKIIELFPNNRLINCFYHISMYYDLDYYYLIEKTFSISINDWNIEVDLSRIQILLDTILSNWNNKQNKTVFSLKDYYDFNNILSSWIQKQDILLKIQIINKIKFICKIDDFFVINIIILFNRLELIYSNNETVIITKTKFEDNYCYKKGDNCFFYKGDELSDSNFNNLIKSMFIKNNILIFKFIDLYNKI